jgi:hypothetical protein
MTTPLNKKRRLLVAAPILASIALAACGSDDDDSSDTTAAPVTAAPTTGAPETTAAPAGETIAVVGSDYAYGGIPATVAPGTKFSFSNSSDKELHELVAIKLPEGEERSVDELLALPEEELGAMMGGEPAMVLLALPSSDETIPAVGDGTVTEPGRYLVACFIPEGADPAEYMAQAQTSEGPPQVEGGPPHFVLGMSAEFTVEG